MGRQPEGLGAMPASSGEDLAAFYRGRAPSKRKAPASGRVMGRKRQRRDVLMDEVELSGPAAGSGEEDEEWSPHGVAWGAGLQEDEVQRGDAARCLGGGARNASSQPPAAQEESRRRAAMAAAFDEDDDDDGHDLEAELDARLEAEHEAVEWSLAEEVRGLAGGDEAAGSGVSVPGEAGSAAAPLGEGRGRGPRRRGRWSLEGPYEPKDKGVITGRDLKFGALLHPDPVIAPAAYGPVQQQAAGHPWCRPPPTLPVVPWVAPAQRRRAVLAARARNRASGELDCRPRPSDALWPQDLALPEREPEEDEVDLAPPPSDLPRPPPRGEDEIELMLRGSSAAREPLLRLVREYSDNRVASRFGGFRLRPAAGAEDEWVVRDGAVVAGPEPTGLHGSGGGGDHSGSCALFPPSATAGEGVGHDPPRG